MRGKVAYVSGYRYTAKDTGLLKEGMTIILETEQDMMEDDGPGDNSVPDEFSRTALYEL